MPIIIIIGALAHVLRNRRDWTSAKERLYQRLRTESVDEIVSILRQGMTPDLSRPLQVRAEERQSHNLMRKPRTWLMASRIARSGPNYVIAIFYFGPDRHLGATDLSVGDQLHDRLVDMKEFWVDWRGDKLEAHPYFPNSPYTAPLHNRLSRHLQSFSAGRAMSTVFISFRHSDRELVVRSIATRLAAGFHYWRSIASAWSGSRELAGSFTENRLLRFNFISAASDGPNNGEAIVRDGLAPRHAIFATRPTVANAETTIGTLLAQALDWRNHLHNPGVAALYRHCHQQQRHHWVTWECQLMRERDPLSRLFRLAWPIDRGMFIAAHLFADGLHVPSLEYSIRAASRVARLADVAEAAKQWQEIIHNDAWMSLFRSLLAARNENDRNRPHYIKPLQGTARRSTRAPSLVISQPLFARTTDDLRKGIGISNARAATEENISTARLDNSTGIVATKPKLPEIRTTPMNRAKLDVDEHFIWPAVVPRQHSINLVGTPLRLTSEVARTALIAEGPAWQRHDRSLPIQPVASGVSIARCTDEVSDLPDDAAAFSACAPPIAGSPFYFVRSVHFAGDWQARQQPATIVIISPTPTHGAGNQGPDEDFERSDANTCAKSFSWRSMATSEELLL